METLKETTERNKEKAKIFLEGNIRAFIENFSEDYFFCNILEVHENFVIVSCFAGQRKGEVERVFFIDIKKFEEYEEKK